MDALRREILQGERQVHLTRDEHVLLYTLIVRAGAVVSFADLANAIGRGSFPIRANSIARHITSLRRKLRDDFHRPNYIETVIGVGYRFVIED